MVTEGLKPFLKNIQAHELEEAELCNYVAHLNDWRNAWNDLNDVGEESSRFDSVLETFTILIRASLNDATLKPSINEVRGALSIAENAMQFIDRKARKDATEKIIHDLVAAFSVSRAGETMLEAARKHCQESVRDANMNSLFSAAVGECQSSLDEKFFFDDPTAFVLRGGNNGTPYDAVSFVSVITNCQTVAIARCVPGVVHVA